jgi:type 1 fimbria pilin
MIKNTKKIALGILIIGFIALMAGIAAAADEVSITGTINDQSQLVADSGTTYDIGDNEKGNEVMDLVGKKVSVKGTVMEAEGTKIITITAFDVIE